MTRRVIFVDPSIWTNKESTVSDQPVPVARRLTDDERQLLVDLTVWCVAEQTGVSDTEAARALDDLHQRSPLCMEGDNIDVRVTCNGHVIVHCTREWLAFHAHSGEQLTSEELRRNLNYWRGNTSDGASQ